MNGESFDLFRLSNSKKAVGISTPTIRKYFTEGLRSYKRDKAVFVSKTELAQFLKTPKPKAPNQ